MSNPGAQHIHRYDEQGRQLCCTLEEKIEVNTNPPHSDHDGHDHSTAHTAWREYLPVIISLTLLTTGIALDHGIKAGWFTEWIRLVWYLAAYLPVAISVWKEAVQGMVKGAFFTEFFLMGLATVGAFAIGEYPEGVAVMVFYTIGELFQTAAVRRAKGNIKALLDVRPERASALRGGQFTDVNPEAVAVGDTIRVRPGERVPLDGVVSRGQGSFDTAALTGESKPRTIREGEPVLAGMVSLDSLLEINVRKPFGESSIARILELVQNATARKAPTELFIRKFAKIYTPIVVLLATLLVIAPYWMVPDYSFQTWLYRALIFLVISCPCALVISIPLGYFGGIGAASRHGILFKGSNFLDLMGQVNMVVLDKTGTLTRGVFQVRQVVSVPDNLSGAQHPWLPLVAALEQHSTHPVAKAILTYAGEQKTGWQHLAVSQVQELAGLGLAGKVAGQDVMVGNTKLLRQYRIAYPPALDTEPNTIAVVAINGRFAGFITIADEIKSDAQQTVEELRRAGVRELVMLSGDKNSIVQNTIATLGIDQGFGDLLPQDKVEKLEALKRDKPARVIAFVGDGINDAPVLALADVGIAMGGLGSEVAIETADVVIQTDQPSRVATAIYISRATSRIVWQNIGLAFGVKIVVLLLGAGGLATMWEAVFADVGVALLAVLNAVRVQRIHFN